MTVDSLALLRGLLEAYSPTGEEAGAAAYLVERMVQLGYTAGLDGVGNPTGVRGDGRREILLLGHIDTVPGNIPVREEAGCLYGRGAVDAKGPLACFAAAGALAQVRPGWRIRVTGAVGEEGDSRGAHYLVQHAQAPAMVVIGEPGGWDHIGLGYKGSLWVDYELEQPLAHTAARSLSACDQAVAFWNGVLDLANRYNQPFDRAFDQLSPSLRGMHSDSDGFQERAQLKINLRLPLGVQPESLIEQLTHLAGPGRLQVWDSLPAYRAEKNTPLVRALLAAVRQAGGKPGFSLKTGTSDMNLVGPAWGCPVAAYGPGDSSLDHTPQEHIVLAEYLQGIQVLTQALNTLMETEP